MTMQQKTLEDMRYTTAKTGFCLADSDIEKWFLKQDVSTRQQMPPAQLERNRLSVNKIDVLFQTDLVDRTAFENDGVCYLLACTEVFSKHPC